MTEPLPFETATKESERVAWRHGFDAGLEGMPCEVPAPRNHDAKGQIALLPGVKVRHKPRGGAYARFWRGGWAAGSAERRRVRGD